MTTTNPLGIVVSGANFTVSAGSTGNDILITLLGTGSPTAGYGDYAQNWTLAASGVANDATPFVTSPARKYVRSLRDAMWTCRTILGTPQDGFLGNFSFPSGGLEYLANFKSYRMNISRAVNDITPFQNANGWRTYTPGLYTWSVSASAFADTQIAVTPPIQQGTSGATAEPQQASFVVLNSKGNTKTLSGNVWTTSSNQNITQGETAMVDFTFQGDGPLVTTVGHTGSTYGTALWIDDASNSSTSALSVLANDITGTFAVNALSSNAGMAYQGYVIWSSIDIDVEVGRNIVVTAMGKLSQSRGGGSNVILYTPTGGGTSTYVAWN